MSSTTSSSNNCLTDYDIKILGGSIVENLDGTVSVYLPTGPLALTMSCCKLLGYSFNINTQECVWTGIKDNAITPPIVCDINNPFLITLNPNGNDGSLFNINDGEDCFLNIEFDYVIKLKCENLSQSLNGGKISGVLNENRDLDQILLETRIIEAQASCDNIANEIYTLQLEINNTSYSIVCENVPQTDYVVDLSAEKISNFGKTGFGVAPFSYVDPNFKLANQPTTYCISEPDGLSVWSSILGSRYNSFLAGDASSYTCDDVNAMVLANNDSKSTLITECSTPFGAKTNLLNRLNYLLKQQSICTTNLSNLESQLTQRSQPKSNDPSDCDNPTYILETLDISLLLEIVSGTSLVTVLETPLFPYTDVSGPIGVGNLYTYLTGRTDSGFYLCGDSSGECVPFSFQSLINPSIPTTNADSCDRIAYGIIRDIYIESGLPDTTQPNIDIFVNSVPSNAFSSSWLHYNNLITDENIINAINGEKIKISLKVNSTCGNFCVLIDDIKLNKTCTVVNNDNLFVTQSPGFTLERIRDNKKSWINNTTRVNRPFNISTNIDTNIIRQTNYDVNDERLVINTKEIDLDVDISSAIEQDVFCYIADNSCLLDSLTGVTSGTCGDFNVDIQALLTTDISDILTVDDFNDILHSELVDVKNRQTLSGYPTLRALYDRYLNSSIYCPTNSSAFNYLTMDQFAGLLGNYWVDLVEQVVPATTIWGSVKIYSNTIFDQQKYRYKQGTMFTCVNSGDSVDTNIIDTTVSVDSYSITSNDNKLNKCSGVYMKQINIGSSFYGTVTTEDTMITEDYFSGNTQNF